MKIAYYPGCSGEGTSKEYEVSTRAICKALDIQLTEIDDWNCCGSTPGHSIDHALSGALSARNLVLAHKMDADCVATPCPSCLSNLKHAKHRMTDEEFKEQVDYLLDEKSPDDLPEAYSILQIILEKMSLDEIKAKVKKPLKGLKIACYYGCLMVRPPKVMQFDDYENPVSLDNLMVALGAEVVPFSLKTECCGAAMGVVDKNVSASLSGRILENAKQFGANCVVAACPLCQMNLDLRQFQANSAFNQQFDLPVFYYTQLLGIAFDLHKEDILLEKLAVNPQPVLDHMEQTIIEEGKKEAAAKKAEAEKLAKAEKAKAEKEAAAKAKAEEEAKAKAEEPKEEKAVEGAAS